MNRIKVELTIGRVCLDNPGAGGLAYTIEYWENINGTDISIPRQIEGAQGFRLTTNNRIEIMSAIYGINAILELIKSKRIKGRINQVSLNCDSEYLCDAVNLKWVNRWKDNNWMTTSGKSKPIYNSDLWEQLIDSENALRRFGINVSGK